MAQPLKVLSAFPEGLSLDSSTQVSFLPPTGTSTHIADTHSHEEKFKNANSLAFDI